ncbi:hypothetical protein EYF80_024807 [Liparis tanakae]|uniref:Uncharacterized protein n=1 Tax=Liparis tanakae TaxID=230148 RepID=A0A4Z2HJ04_9TELE|nr:hypothetical protein EYF80_024807 [Liparis tanakae]
MSSGSVEASRRLKIKLLFWNERNKVKRRPNFKKVEGKDNRAVRMSDIRVEVKWTDMSSSTGMFINTNR